MTDIPHVVILGGGFGGLATANEIRNSLTSSQVKITVIDKKDWFMVGFAKLWIMTGERTFEDSIGRLDQLPKKDIDFVQAEVSAIDLQNKSVQTKQEKIPYDFLVISLGAALAPQKIPGLKEYGFNLYDHDDIHEIQTWLLNMKSGRIAIAITGMPYKCPPAPFEASLLIDSILRKRGVRDSVEIDFYSPAPITLPAAGPDVSKKVLEMINSGKITFHDSTKIKSVESHKLIFENGEADFELLVAVPPHTAPKIIYDCGLAKEPGFIPIDRDCKTPFEDVFAIGDVTSMVVTEKMAVPKAGVFAEGEGVAVAKSIVSKISSMGEPEPFDGKGGCFIESGRDTASIIEVDMFSQPKPSTRLTDQTAENLVSKKEFEKERLSKWL